MECPGFTRRQPPNPKNLHKQYQDIVALPGTDPGLNPPPTPYRDLAYEGFSVNAAGTPIIGTTDNSIYYDVVTQLLLGEPSISKTYSGSTVTNFDLNSFTFVCVLQTLESVKGVGTNCTLNISGVKSKSVKKSCKFVQKVGTLDITPAKCVLGSQFVGLNSVAFETVPDIPVAGDEVVLTALDNVAVEVRRTC
ncbi:MAG: hypothetical protein LQ351_007064 [Letrouitia transgressa]|nr:MAG: hypothetical protein LQ351_007064 [Letrouitia transgressa]